MSASDGTNCNGITVSWTSTLAGTGFRIYRGPNANGAGATVLTTVTSSPVVDPTAVPGVINYYWVQQYGGACGTATPPGGPDGGWVGDPNAPTGLTADDGVECDRVHVDWNPSAFAASYDVARSTTDLVGDAVVLGNVTPTAFDDLTAVGAPQYWYWVRARSATGCVGPFNAVAEPGHALRPPLPDLEFDPANAGGYIQITPLGRRELRFATSFRNAGTARLHLFRSWMYWDATSDVRQQVLECDGGVDDRYLGRFPDPEGFPEVPHFARARVRMRLPGSGDPGLVVAQADMTSRCIFDDSSWNSALPGWPSTAQYGPNCRPVQGISVGWQTYRSSGEPQNKIELDCVGPGEYWLELEIDPDDQIRELDETNNVVRALVDLASLPPINPLVCPGPAVVGRLLSPDSLAAAVGAATDSIVGSAWVAGLTEGSGADPNVQAEVGYALAPAPFKLADPPWTWAPATWRRQDGAEDVYGGSISVPSAGEYVFAMRFNVVDGPWVYADFDGSLNGYSAAQAGRLHVATTTDASDDPPAGTLAFDVLSNPTRGTTHFRVSLPSASDIRLTVYDARGRAVRALERSVRPTGVHVIAWDGRDDAGRATPRGVYLARLETAGGALVQKVLCAR